MISSEANPCSEDPDYSFRACVSSWVARRAGCHLDWFRSSSSWSSSPLGSSLVHIYIGECLERYCLVVGRYCADNWLFKYITEIASIEVVWTNVFRYGSFCDRVALFCVWCVHCVCVWHLLLQFFWTQYFTHLVCLTCLRCYTIRKDNKQFHVLYVHDWGCLEKNMTCVWRV